MIQTNVNRNYKTTWNGQDFYCAGNHEINKTFVFHAYFAICVYDGWKTCCRFRQWCESTPMIAQGIDIKWKILSIAVGNIE